MTNVPDLPGFDRKEGQVAKEEGMELAAQNRSQMLYLARRIAEEIARKYGQVSADDVQAELIRRGYQPAMLGNAAGSIFSDHKWRRVGRTQSSRISNHARWIFVWALRE